MTMPVYTDRSSIFLIAHQKVNLHLVKSDLTKGKDEMKRSKVVYVMSTRQLWKTRKR